METQPEENVPLPSIQYFDSAGHYQPINKRPGYFDSAGHFEVVQRKKSKKTVDCSEEIPEPSPIETVQNVGNMENVKTVVQFEQSAMNIVRQVSDTYKTTMVIQSSQKIALAVHLFNQRAFQIRWLLNIYKICAIQVIEHCHD